MKNRGGPSKSMRAGTLNKESSLLGLTHLGLRILFSKNSPLFYSCILTKYEYYSFSSNSYSQQKCVLFSGLQLRGLDISAGSATRRRLRNVGGAASGSWSESTQTGPTDTTLATLVSLLSAILTSPHGHMLDFWKRN